MPVMVDFSDITVQRITPLPGDRHVCSWQKSAHEEKGNGIGQSNM